MKINRAQALKRFTVEIEFDDGLIATVDLSNLAGKGVFAVWAAPGAFEDCTVGSGGELMWRCGVDLCADALYLKATGKRLSEVCGPDSETKNSGGCLAHQEHEHA
ncbi:MAG: DUF2442 domain-containing protein [Deltaproteobacteria bacterium]|nr:DUF2442 domain-containing protein [Deltaproteobacteria bacterium]